jgi:hypothetical protein
MSQKSIEKNPNHKDILLQLKVFSFLVSFLVIIVNTHIYKQRTNVCTYLNSHVYTVHTHVHDYLKFLSWMISKTLFAPLKFAFFLLVDIFHYRSTSAPFDFFTNSMLLQSLLQ